MTIKTSSVITTLGNLFAMLAVNMRVAMRLQRVV